MHKEQYIVALKNNKIDLLKWGIIGSIFLTAVVMLLILMSHVNRADASWAIMRISNFVCSAGFGWSLGKMLTRLQNISEYKDALKEMQKHE